MEPIFVRACGAIDRDFIDTTFETQAINRIVGQALTDSVGALKSGGLVVREDFRAHRHCYEISTEIALTSGEHMRDLIDADKRLTEAFQTIDELTATINHLELRNRNMASNLANDLRVTNDLRTELKIADDRLNALRFAVDGPDDLADF